MWRVRATLEQSFDQFDNAFALFTMALQQFCQLCLGAEAQFIIAMEANRLHSEFDRV